MKTMGFKLRASTTLYILDAFCMFSALALGLFVLYLLPYVFLNYTNYDIPEYVINLNFWYQTHTSQFGMVLGFLGPLVLGIIGLLMISRLITFYLETHEHEPGLPHIEQSEIDEHRQPKTRHSPSVRGPTAMIVILISLVIFLVFLAEYFVFFSIL